MAEFKGYTIHYLLRGSLQQIKRYIKMAVRLCKYSRGTIKKKKENILKLFNK